MQRPTAPIGSFVRSVDTLPAAGEAAGGHDRRVHPLPHLRGATAARRAGAALVDVAGIELIAMVATTARELRVTLAGYPDAARRLALAADANQPIATIGEIGISPGVRALLTIGVADADPIFGGEAAAVEDASWWHRLPFPGATRVTEGIALPARTAAALGAAAAHKTSLGIVVAWAAAASLWAADVDATAFFSLLAGLVVRLAAAHIRERIAAHGTVRYAILAAFTGAGAGLG